MIDERLISVSDRPHIGTKTSQMLRNMYASASTLVSSPASRAWNPHHDHMHASIANARDKGIPNLPIMVHIVRCSMHRQPAGCLLAASCLPATSSMHLRR